MKIECIGGPNDGEIVDLADVADHHVYYVMMPEALLAWRASLDIARLVQQRVGLYRRQTRPHHLTPPGDARDFFIWEGET